MPRIILIETATAQLSTALLDGEEIVARRVSAEPRAHASMTAPFVAEMLAEGGLRVQDCDAVCVSKGPGSYTGLRVGSSTAKGLCFAAGIPLISVGTLDALAWQAIGEGLPEGCTAIMPMIDARRMEVYTALFSTEGERLTEVEAKIMEGEIPGGARNDSGDSGSPASPSSGMTVYIGDGVEKCREILAGEADRRSGIWSPGKPVREINSGRASARLRLPAEEWLRQEYPLAESMAVPALRAWDEKRFENTAYFEPFYLKDFVATVARNPLLRTK